MSQHDIRSAARPDPDAAMVDIADYVIDYRIDSTEAFDTARYMLLDSLACAMLAMKFPDCVKHLGPLVPGAILPGGARVRRNTQRASDNREYDPPVPYASNPSTLDWAMCKSPDRAARTAADTAAGTALGIRKMRALS